MPARVPANEGGQDPILQYEVEINGRVRQVTVHRVNGRFAVAIERRQWMVDVARIDAHTWSLLIDEEGRTSSHEVSVAVSAEAGALNVRVNGAPVAVGVNGTRRPWPRSLRQAPHPPQLTHHRAQTEHDQPANHRNQNHPWPQVIRSHTLECRRPPMKEKKIRKQPDKLIQRVSHQARDQPNGRRQKRNQHNPKLRRL